MSNIVKINLLTLKRNATIIKKRLKKGVKFCAVVKADAYGHGAVECANALYPIVDCFAVAIIEEGVALRQAGIDKDILILTPIEKAEIARAVECGLTLSVSTVTEVINIDKESFLQCKKTKIHIAYNTGMNRLGVKSLIELKKILTVIKEKKNVILDGFYSHLAFPENKKATTVALDKFLLAKKVIKRYNNKVTCHISASGGFLIGAQEDMVRIGILLYGYKPFESDILVKPIMKVYSNIVAHHRLKQGDCALYGNKKSKEDINIAILRYGYADGLFRKEVGGQFNNRCMDLTAIISDKKSGMVCVLDNAEDLAKKYKTISYEILCSVGRRAKKIYIR